MQISLENIGRRFNREWIFRGITYTFTQDNAYAILGPNGSGKSTLLQILAGTLSPSEGVLSYQSGAQSIGPEMIFRDVAIAAPYLELIEEFSLQELLEFHFSFKRPLAGHSVSSLISLMKLEKARHKQLKYFSSGMKQRVKLALAIGSDTPILLLDEPTSNLDTEGIDWYQGMIAEFASNRLVFVGSNQAHEYEFCTERLLIIDYK